MKLDGNGSVTITDWQKEGRKEGMNDRKTEKGCERHCAEASSIKGVRDIVLKHQV